MFCPKCSPKNSQHGTQFCSQCGFFIKNAENFVDRNGKFSEDDETSARRKGIRQGAKPVLLSLVLLPALILLSALFPPHDVLVESSPGTTGSEPIGETVLRTTFLAGIARIAFAALFGKKPAVGKMLDAVSGSNNAHVKARVFSAAALQLRAIEGAPGFIPATAIIGKSDAAARIRDSLTRVLNSDTVGITTSLEHDARNGDGIAAYVESMLAGGKAAELGGVVARLSKGNDLMGDPLARFGAQVRGTDGNPHYRNAQVLGYFAGALFAGAKQITGDRAKQADMLKNIFGTIAGATGAANPASGVVSSVLNGLTQAIVNEATDGLNKGATDMQEAIEKLLFPRHAGTGALYEGAAEVDFDSAFSRVVLRNQ